MLWLWLGETCAAEEGYQGIPVISATASIRYRAFLSWPLLPTLPSATALSTMKSRQELCSPAGKQRSGGVAYFIFVCWEVRKMSVWLFLAFPFLLTSQQTNIKYTNHRLRCFLLLRP